MNKRLFCTEFQDSGLKLRRTFVDYSSITEISHFNRRHIVNFIPQYEVFCISIKYRNGKRALLFSQIKIRKYVGGKTFKESLKLGLRIPLEIEEKLTNLRYEYLATIELLKQRSGVTPRTRGVFYEYMMEILSIFVESNRYTD